MSLLRIFAVMLVAVSFTLVGCKKDTGNTPGETTGTEAGEPTNTDEDVKDGAPAEQPDDAEAGDDAEGGDDGGDADEPAPAAEKKDGE